MRALKRHRDAGWDRLAAAWDAEAGDTGVRNQRLVIDPVLLDVLGPVKGKRVLEIGCGNGYLSRVLARRGARVTAVDFSRKMVEFAAAREQATPLGIRYLRRDAARLSGLRSGSFDAVVADMCLMDIRDLAGAAREASRVLKPGGRLVFSITHPVFADWGQTWIWLRHEGKRYFARGIPTYLTPTAKVVWFPVFGMTNIYKTTYHRPVETYLRTLAATGLLVDDYRDIRSGKPTVKARPGDRDVSRRRTLYRTEAEKRAKERAQREIPVFLVVGAVKGALL